MKPMLWLYLFFMFIIITIFYLIFNSFIMIYNTSLIFNKNKKNFLSWKW